MLNANNKKFNSFANNVRFNYVNPVILLFIRNKKWIIHNLKGLYLLKNKCGGNYNIMHIPLMFNLHILRHLEMLMIY